jgi:KH domain
LIDLCSPQPPNDEVVIRGEKNLVKKVAAELERVVTSLRERVVLGVVIPNQRHKSLIGHGGQPLTELEKKTGAEVQFPGSRSYHQVATPSNLEELGDAEEKDIVKVAGSKSACEKAITELRVCLITVSHLPSLITSHTGRGGRNSCPRRAQGFRTRPSSASHEQGPGSV